MSWHSDDPSLRVLAGAVNDIHSPTRAAWLGVRATMRAAVIPAPRRFALRSVMASVSAIAAFFVFSQASLINALADPTVTAGFVPAPQVALSTPVASVAQPAATMTPQPGTNVAPIPLPPARS
jgi:hypothetical protein